MKGCNGYLENSDYDETWYGFFCFSVHVFVQNAGLRKLYTIMLHVGFYTYFFTSAREA